MPRAMPVAGLQHVTNNLSADVEKSLEWWQDYFAQLKNVEALLGTAERQRRLQWTCFRHRFPQHEAAFEKFGGSLYEKRWHEVVRFIRAFRPLLPLLHLGWDQERYERGVGPHGDPIGKITGSVAFSPGDLSKSLRSPLFWRYTDMVLCLEEVGITTTKSSIPLPLAPPISSEAFCFYGGLLPVQLLMAMDQTLKPFFVKHNCLFCLVFSPKVTDKLAQWCESCPCHHNLLAVLHEGWKQRCIEQHYQGATSSCPMAGLRAPDLASGKLEEVAQELMSHADVSVLASEIPAETSAMPQSEWQLLKSDFNKGRAVALTTLQIKTSFWRTLPWLLCGLAHSNPRTVQAVATQAMLAWQADPRPEGHHPVTQSFFSEPFLTSMQELANGRVLSTLPCAFQLAVSELCFVPVVETTIESKHSRATLAKGVFKMGPVGLSLSNRSIMLERWLRSGFCSVEELLHHFAIARTASGTLSSANLEKHPAFQKGDGHAQGHRQPRLSRAGRRKLTLQLLYQCDMDTLYTDMTKAKIVNREAQRLGGQLAGALMKKKESQRTMPETLNGVKLKTGGGAAKQCAGAVQQNNLRT